MTRIDNALNTSKSFSSGLALRSNRIYDKLALLVAITAGVGLFSYNTIANSSAASGALMPCFIVAMGCALLGQFKPQYVKAAAPVYAVAEGVVLGVISKIYASTGGGVVPVSIAATGLLFVGCLAVFRSGLVKVTPRFIQMTAVAGIALFGMYILAMFGLAIPGINDIGPKGMIFGIIGLGIGLSYLFIDFDKIRRAEDAGNLHANAEWFLAFQLLLSLVMVYVNVLRVIGSSSRRN